MSYQPPFTITTDILNLVAQISQQVGELNASQLNASPQLRKQNRIKTITGTLAIEGNSLTEEQITAIVEGKPEQADQLADSTPFIHFMLTVINQTLEKNALVNTSQSTLKNAPVKTPEAILHLLRQHPDFTRQQLADNIGKDIRTIGRAISKLQQQGKLTRVGADKTGHWQVLT